MSSWPRLSWVDAEPRRHRAEIEAMAAIAPDLEWIDRHGGGWAGLVPMWPFHRDPPDNVEAFLAGRRLRIEVEYIEAFPVAAPRIWPRDPEPHPAYRSMNAWHVNPNGSLCLMQSAHAWDGTETAADLVIKAAGWFLEYLLMERGIVEAMSTQGVAAGTSLDHLFDQAHHAT